MSTSRFWGVLTAALSIAACSGKTIDTNRTVEPPGYVDSGTGGSAGGSLGTGGAPASGGASSAGGAGGTAGAAVDAGSTRCDFAHTTCGGSDSYIEIVTDAGVTRLALPMDSGCGACNARGCELWTFATSACGTLSLRVAACAGPNGALPCLDTTNYPFSSYVDGTGQRFDDARLYTHDTSVTPDAAGVLDFSGILSVYTASGILVETPVHVHVCGGDVRVLAPPC